MIKNFTKFLTKEQRFQFYMYIIETGGKVFIKLFQSIVVIYLIYQLPDIFKAVAGKDTNFSLLIKLFTDAGPGTTITILIIYSIGITYVAWRQSRLKQSNIERMSGQNIKLETHIDGERSSSNLTTKGKTNPIDQ